MLSHVATMEIGMGRDGLGIGLGWADAGMGIGMGRDSLIEKKYVVLNCLISFH